MDIAEVAKSYVYQNGTGLLFKGYNGYPDYPAGQLRTSIADFSTLWAGYLNSDNTNTGFILSPKTTNEITPVPSMAQEGFYTWFIYSANNHLYYFHPGGDLGVSSVVLIDVRKKRGIIIFANSEIKFNKLVGEIEKEMWSE